MASRYDQPDAPDDDRYDDKPVDAADEPHDGEPWPDAIQGRGYIRLAPFGDAIDPAEHATHTIIDAFTTLQMELAKASTTERAFTLRRMIQGLEVQIAAVADAAAQKVEDFTR